MPFSAIDAISPAVEHTKRQLLQPFRVGQWTRLAVVGLLAGELSSGGCNVPSFPNSTAPVHPGIPGGNLMLFAGLFVVLMVAAFVVGLVLMYVSSVMRFILFDSVVAKECHIRQGWSRRQGPGWRYFVWKLLYVMVMLGVMIVLLGIPLGFAFAMGWVTEPKEHLVPLVLCGIVLFFLFAALVIGTLLIYVLTKDFVVPQMALEDIGVMEGWSRLWTMMKAEKGGYAGYVGMKIVLAIGAGIVIAIVSFIVALIILIPIAGLAAGTLLAGKAAGLGWTVSTITLAVVEGCTLFAAFLYVMSLITVPAIVFFPAYSIYFFAARYPALAAVLYPAPPAPQIPPAAPIPTG